jgi:WD40 repeat protein
VRPFALLLLFTARLAAGQVRADPAATDAPSPHKLALDRVVLAAFSPDGRALMTVSADDRQCHFWDVRSGDEVNRFGDAVANAIFSADGSRVMTSGRDGIVRIFDSKTGKALRRLEGLDLPPRAMALSPDGSRAATSADAQNSIRLWDASTGQQIARLDGHESPPNVLAFSPDATRLASASGQATASTPLFFAHRGAATGPPTTAPAARSDNTIRIWDLGQKSQSKIVPAGAATAIAFSASGRTLLAASADATESFDVASGKAIAKQEERFPAGLSTADRKYTLRHFLGGATLIDVQTAQEVRKLEGPLAGLPLHHAFSQDGARVILGTGTAALFQRNPEAPGGVYVFDVASGKRLARLVGHRREVTQVAISPDGRYAFSRDGEKRLLLWELPTR